MPKPLTYKSSGVDIDQANIFVKAIQRSVKGTWSKNVLQREGAFGGLFALDQPSLKRPVMVSSTDGVGTKLLIAQALGKHDTVGIDLVAMNVNDILCTGAKPLFFLDYIACGRLKPDVLKDVVKGIAQGCRQSGCSLIGGETAEMPDMYKPGEYDLAGFAVGVVEESALVDGRSIKSGDVVLGLPSSGIHSNGYSLVRKVFSKTEQVRLAKDLLEPTRIYAREVACLMDTVPVRGMAHITGGAFYEKLTKVLPKGLCFQIDRNSWSIPPIFQTIQEKGRVADQEMFRTFNMGIGYAVVIRATDIEKARAALKKKRIKHFIIGHVIRDAKRRIIL